MKRYSGRLDICSEMDISNLAGASCLGVYCKQCFTNSGFPKSFVNNSCLIDHLQRKHGIPKNQRAEVIDAVRIIRAREANGVVRYFDDELREGFFCNYCTAHFYEHRMKDMIKTHMKKSCTNKGAAISTTTFLFKTSISGHHVIQDNDVNLNNRDSDIDSDSKESDSEESDSDSEESEVMEKDKEDDETYPENKNEPVNEIIDLTMDSSDKDSVIEVMVDLTNASVGTAKKNDEVVVQKSDSLEILAETAIRKAGGITGSVYQQIGPEDLAVPTVNETSVAELMVAVELPVRTAENSVAKYLKGRKQIYTPKDMDIFGFEEMKKECDKVNQKKIAVFVPGVSRPSLSKITLNEVGLSKIRDVFFDEDGSLKRNIIKDCVMKDNHHFIMFEGAVYADMRWQVPIEKHSRKLGVVPTRRLIEEILEEEGIIDLEKEMITEMGMIMGGTMDQPIHHDIARRFTRFVYMNDENKQEELEGWELDRDHYNNAMSSSTAPFSILIGMGKQSKVMLGVPKSRVNIQEK